MDQQTTVGELKQVVDKFVKDRDWERYHDPKNLAMAIAIEAAEFMDIFKWRTNSECVQAMKQGEIIDAVKNELADIIIYTLAFANRNDIDLADIITMKVKKNIQKYPINKFKGHF